jgi:hypothetical protein
MPRVALIVTGRLEQVGLPSALRRLFPGVEFLPEYFEGFTSCRLTSGPAAPRPIGIGTNAEKMATAMMLALDPGRREIPADYAFALEDLELANDDQPERVVNAFREAVRSCLPGLHNTALRQNRCETQVPLRCSFHLLRPMIEAYLFADPEALRRAGVKQAPSLVPGCDLEDFETDDPGYREIISASQVGPASRLHHPKWYLRWLCDPTGEPREKAFRETKGGVAALAGLDWNRVLGQPGRCPFLRSFVADLADALELSPPFPDGGCHPLTARHHPGRKDRLLRNG